MKKAASLFLIISLFLGLTGCTTDEDFSTPQVINNQPANPVLTEVQTNKPDFEKSPTPKTLTPSVPIPENNAVINPLTGLPALHPELLERRPIIIKIQNVPRSSRPQFGLSLADQVYEYIIEFGDTRMAAVYYGADAQKAGPIRSARHVDIQLVNMYKSILIFGGAYEDLYKQMVESDFGDRLVREGPNTAPALFRYEPNGRNYLMANTALIPEVLQRYQVQNERQDLQGFTFSQAEPAKGQAAAKVTIRFSASMYNRWTYDSQTKRYLRSSETQNANSPEQEDYQAMIDPETQQPIGFENLVILFTDYIPLVKTSESEVFDIPLHGEGKAFLVRDGKLFNGNWKRSENNKLLSLVDEAGNPLALKPGKTWFSLLDTASKAQSGTDGWRFSFLSP
jgi:hypothetical protein